GRQFLCVAALALLTVNAGKRPTEDAMTTAAEAPVGADLRALPELLTAAEGWEELRAALVAGHSGTVDGAWGSSAALAAAALAARGRKIAAGETVDPSELAEWLVANGYKRVDAVEYPGEFGRRGGICDIFPPDAPDPLRLEFFGDELESIRTFAVSSQRSLEK